MAIYHCQIKPLSRSTGRSAIAAAAYRAGVKLCDEQSGLIHDYRRRSGVVDATLFLPEGMHAIPEERNQIWNAAEAAEKRKDARTAREYEIALPCELSEEKRCYLAWSFAVELANRYGVAVDVAVHRPSEDGDTRNHHAHLLATTRKIQRGEDSSLCFGEKASIELSDKKRRERGLCAASDEVKAIRRLWEQMTNSYLAEEGQLARIDSRSLKAQGSTREPTRHLGVSARAFERRTGQPSRKRLDWRETITDRQAQKAIHSQLIEQRKAAENQLSRVESALKETQQLQAKISDGRAAFKAKYQAEKSTKETQRQAWERAQALAAEMMRQATAKREEAKQQEEAVRLEQEHQRQNNQSRRIRR